MRIARQKRTLTPAAQKLLVRLAEVFPSSLVLSGRSDSTIAQLFRCHLIEVDRWWISSSTGQRIKVRLRGRLPARRRR